MALKPRDLIHANQIEAGTVGRRRGHHFEKLFAARVSALSPSIELVDKSGHLYRGRPEELLIFYILNSTNRKRRPKYFRGYALGGHATGEGGDLLLNEDASPILKAKSDILIEIEYEDSVVRHGVSVKTCSKKSPTNDQLFCSTAEAFCDLLVKNDIEVSASARRALRMFCGDSGYTPSDLGSPSSRLNKERWYWEELPADALAEWEIIFTENQALITTLLLTKGYSNDPIVPEFLLHQTVAYDSIEDVEVALFTIQELVQLSCQFCGFETSEYYVRKGRFKDPTTKHLAPRFGFVQFQRLGNKQNATQLQFNLQAGYFYKLPTN